MLEHLGGDDPVERPVGEGKAQGIALHDAGLRLAGHQLAGVDHGPEGGPDPDHLVGPGVEGHHPGPPPGRLEGVTAEAAAQVEQPVTGHQAQHAVVDGQHPTGSRFTGGPASGAPGRGRPASKAS